MDSRIISLVFFRQKAYNKYNPLKEMSFMDPNTLFSGLMLFITTTMSILASAVIAYLTFRRQNQKDLRLQNRLREINCDTAIELFQAQIASLAFFLPDGNPDFSKGTLTLYCKKLNVIESYLADMTDSDLPDSFIPQFQYYRLISSLTKTSIEHRIEQSASDSLPLDSFDDLDIPGLINEINAFITVNQRT